ncbi:hypothetical protein JA1_001670 [Spathaspora sp. JA1]|nr:hypothetical protein JA1_001670 [Spathaspora sp. JA1]
MTTLPLEFKKRIAEFDSNLRLNHCLTSDNYPPIRINPYIELPKYEETILFYDFQDLKEIDPKNYYYSTKINKEIIQSLSKYRLEYQKCKNDKIFENISSCEYTQRKPNDQITPEINKQHHGMTSSKSLPSFKQFMQKEHSSFWRPKTSRFKKLITGGSLSRK